MSQIPAAGAGVASRLVDGVAVALTERDQTLHTFEGPVSTYIWTRIDGRRSLAQILDEVLSAFEVERGQALDDLVGFVQRLRERGLISLRGPNEPSGTDPVAPTRGSKNK